MKGQPGTKLDTPGFFLADKVTYQGRRHELGDTWKCECGVEQKLGGFYLAAHWHEALIHTCACGRRHQIENGCIRLKRKVLAEDTRGL